LVLAFDLVAALGDDSSKTFAAGRTRVLVNSDVAPTVAFQFDRDAKVDVSQLQSQLEGIVGPDSVEMISATGLATALLGDSIATNFFVVGVAVQRGFVPIGVAAIERAIELNGTAVKFNLEAFRLGRLFAVNPGKVASLHPQRAAPLAQTIEAIVERQARHLTNYQGPKLADRFYRKIEEFMTLEASLGLGEHVLSQTVAINYARVLSYKDEYEVARLLSATDLDQSLRKAFEPGARLEYNLAPPFLGGKLVAGRPAKRAFSVRSMRPVLKVLARLKFLRGTLFDPFARTLERRSERALIGHYEELLDVVSATLSAQNHGRAVELLGHVAKVRGYGPVKEEAITAYMREIGALDEAFRSPAPASRAA
jgi:indolepyruvate ferredoxin oxidoreductase